MSTHNDSPALGYSAMPMTPIEQAYKIFADYMINGMSDVDFARRTDEILSSYPDQAKQFRDTAAIFRKKLILSPGRPPLLRDIEKAVAEQPIVITIKQRFYPPLMEQHDFMELIYLYSGSATYLSAGKELAMEVGDLCIIAPNTKHNIYCYDENTRMYSIFMRRPVFDQSFQNTLAKNDALSNFYQRILYQKSANISLIFRTGDDSGLHMLMENMLQEYVSGGSATMTMRIVADWLHLFLSYTVRDYGDRSLTLSWDSLEVYDEISPILTYMQENLADVTLSSVADKFHFSEGYLSRMIKNVTGSTFRTLLKNLRMEQALLLIRQVGTSVEEVMAEVGYSDSAHFVKSFREYSGYTPKEFMRLCNQDESGNVNPPQPVHYNIKITDSARSDLERSMVNTLL